LGFCWLQVANFIWPYMRNGGAWDFVCHNDALSKLADVQIEGFFFFATGLAQSAYWAAIAVHTLITVQFDPSVLTRKTEIATHIICLGGSLLLMIISASIGLFGVNNDTPWGGMKLAYYGTSKLDYRQYWLFWIWLGLLDVTVIICMSWILMKAFWHQLKGNFRWSRNFRVMLFLFVLLTVDGWRWGIQIDVGLILFSKLVSSTQAWANCELVTPNQNCPQGTVLGAQIIVMVFWLLTAPATIAILFLLNPVLYRHWNTALQSRANPFTLGTRTTQQESDTKLTQTVSIAEQ